MEVPDDRMIPFTVFPAHAVLITSAVESEAPEPRTRLEIINFVSEPTQAVIGFTEKPSASQAAIVAVPTPRELPPVKEIAAAKTLAASTPTMRRAAKMRT
jgi:hypothetical protein